MPHLLFENVPLQMVAGACSPAITVRIVGGAGEPIITETRVTVALTAVPSSGFSFSLDASCQSAVSAVDIVGGTDRSVFHVMGIVPASVDVTATATGYERDVAMIPVAAGQPYALAMSGGPMNVSAGTCSRPIDVQLLDELGNAALAVGDMTVQLDALPSDGFALYSDSDCGTPLTDLTVFMGEVSSPLYFRGTVAGEVLLTASSGTLVPASQIHSIVAGFASTLGFVGDSQSVPAGSCSAPVVVESRDEFGNPSAVGGSVTVLLSANPTESFAFYFDSECSLTFPSVGIVSGDSRAQLFFRGTKAGTVQITGEESRLGTATQDHFITATAPARVRFAADATPLEAGACSPERSVELVDLHGNLAPLSASKTLDLSASPSTGFTFHVASDCSDSISSIPLSVGSTGAVLRVRGTATGDHVITATVAGVGSANQVQSIVPAAADRLAFVTEEQFVNSGLCSDAVVVETRDANGNRAPVTAAAEILLSVLPAAAVTFHSDADCLVAVTSLSLQPGEDTATFYFTGTTAQASLVTASADPLLPASQQHTITALASATRLVFKDAAQSVEAGECSASVVLEARDSSDAARAVTGDTVVTVQPNPSANVGIYSDALCMNNGTVMIASGTSTTSFTFTATRAGPLTLTASAPDLTSAQQVQTITAAAANNLVFSTTAQPVTAGACSPVLTVETRDQYGNPANVATSTDVGLTATPPDGLAFYSDSTCDTTVTSVPIGANQGSASFYFRATSAGAVQLRASSTGLGEVTQDHSVVAAPPTVLAFTAGPATSRAGDCAAFALETRDASGNVSAVSSSTDVTLSADPSAGTGFYTDAQCLNATTSVAFAANASTASVYFKGTAAGPFTIAATATGFTTATRPLTVTPAPAVSFVWDVIDSPKTLGVAFAVTVRARDAYANLVTDFLDTATLSIAPSAQLSCTSSCTDTTTTAQFAGGVWSGTVSVGDPAGSARQLTATSGTVAGTSNAFDVQALVIGGTPPIARFVAWPMAFIVGQQVTFDASGSSDLETATADLEVSWDFDGAQTGAPPWTPFTTTKTATFTYPSAGTYFPRVAVRDAEGVVTIVEHRVIAVAAAADLCVVDTTSVSDNGASACNGPFGSDGLLSFIEALRLTNARSGRQVITFAGSGTITAGGGPNGSPTISGDGVDIIGPRGLILNGFSPKFTAGSTRIVGIELTGGNSWSLTGGDLTLEDAEYSNGRINTSRPLTFLRTRVIGCTTSCVVTTEAGASIYARDSEFYNTSGQAIYIQYCGTGDVLDISSTSFAGNGYAIYSGCSAMPLKLVNNTFHGNAYGVRYSTLTTANDNHVLRNNIFSNHAGSAVLCSEAIWTTRDFHLLNGNANNGCLASDPDVLTSVPQYLSPTYGDFRVAFDSPAKDSGGATTADLNGPAPGTYSGAAPDRGARETW